MASLDRSLSPYDIRYHCVAGLGGVSEIFDDVHSVETTANLYAMQMWLNLCQTCVIRIRSHNIILASDLDSDYSLPPKATKLVLDIRKLIASESTMTFLKWNF